MKDFATGITIMIVCIILVFVLTFIDYTKGIENKKLTDTTFIPAEDYTIKIANDSVYILDGKRIVERLSLDDNTSIQQIIIKDNQ